jgi:flagellar capping protein FliD
MSVEVCTDNPMIDTDIRLLNDALSQEGERLGERFRVLADMLKQMGY